MSEDSTSSLSLIDKFKLKCDRKVASREAEFIRAFVLNRALSSSFINSEAETLGAIESCKIIDKHFEDTYKIRFM